MMEMLPRDGKTGLKQSDMRLVGVRAGYAPGRGISG